jgi:hypothetical protein
MLVATIEVEVVKVSVSVSPIEVASVGWAVARSVLGGEVPVNSSTVGDTDGRLDEADANDGSEGVAGPPAEVGPS